MSRCKRLWPTDSGASGPGNAALFWGGAALALGSLGLTATSAFYVMSPQAAALPVLPVNLGDAMAGAISGASMMHLAGTFGTISDLVLAAAALAIGSAEAARGRGGTAVLGWMALAVSAIIFVSVDTLVGFVLSPLAAEPQAASAFLGFKRFFDTLFVLGTFAFGVGGALVLLPVAGRRVISRNIALPGLLIAIIGGIGSLATLFGLDLHLFMGLSLAGGGLIFALVGIMLAWSVRTH
jgi:hypothetical protein